MPEYPKSKQLARGARRYRRKVASPKQWAAIRAAKLDGRICRLIEDEPDVAFRGDVSAARELHHLVSRSLGGDDVADNLVGVCRPCHELIEARDVSTLTLLGTLLTEAERAYVVGKLGEGAMARLFGV